MSDKYLSKEEQDQLIKILELLKVSKAEVARILGKEPATAGYWLNNYKFDRLKARELVRVLKERAVKGLDGLKF
jgi:hypothetical protein